MTDSQECLWQTFEFDNFLEDCPNSYNQSIYVDTTINDNTCDDSCRTDECLYDGGGCELIMLY